MGGIGSGAHIGQVRPHEAAGSKLCVPPSPGGGAAAHGRGAAVRAGSAQRPAKPERLLTDAPWAITTSHFTWEVEDSMAPVVAAEPVWATLLAANKSFWGAVFELSVPGCS